MARERPSEAEILAQLPLAAARGRAAAATEPRAKTAYYDTASGRVTIELTSGCAFAFPPALAQGLGSASAAELATVEVMPGAESIYWECRAGGVGGVQRRGRRQSAGLGRGWGSRPGAARHLGHGPAHPAAALIRHRVARRRG